MLGWVACGMLMNGWAAVGEIVLGLTNGEVSGGCDR